MNDAKDVRARATIWFTVIDLSGHPDGCGDTTTLLGSLMQRVRVRWIGAWKIILRRMYRFGRARTSDKKRILSPMRSLGKGCA